MNRILFALVFALPAALAAGASAQSCTDWSNSLGLPHNEPAIVGDLCLVEGTTCYVAGTDFLVVDLTDAAAPVMQGSVVLPAAPVDMLVRGDFVYLLLDGFGLAEIDVSAPAVPALTRSYSSPGLTTLADIDPYLAVGDGTALLRVLDVAPGGEITRISQETMPVTVAKMARAGSFLVLTDYSKIVVMDFSDPLAGVETGRANTYHWDLAAAGSKVYTLTVDPYFESYTCREYAVDGAGGITAGDDYYSYGLPSKFAAGGGLVQAGRPGSVTKTVFLEGTDLSYRSAFLSEAYESSGLSPERWAGVSPTDGLTCLDLTIPDMVAPLMYFGTAEQETHCYDDLAASYCDTYDGDLSGHFWVEQNAHSYYSTGGGSGVTLGYQVFDLTDPLAPVSLCSGSFGIHWDYEGWGGPLSVRIVEDRWLLRIVGSCSSGPVVGIVDLNTGLLVEVLYAEYLGYRDGVLYARHWTNPYSPDPSAVRAYRIEATGQTSLIVDFGQTDPARSYLGGAGDVAVLYDPAGFHVMDYSDPADVVEIGSLPSVGSIYAKVWEGTTMYFRNSSNEVFAIDFSDFTAPAQAYLFTAPKVPIELMPRGDFLVLRYGDGVQLAALYGDGTAAPVSPIIDPDVPSRSAALVGGVLYANDGVGVHLYDVADPANPVFIGQARGSSSDVGITGGYVVNGARVFPPDCAGALAADFVGTPTQGGFPLQVAFADRSSGSPVSWQWTFGDTQTSDAQNPVHTYTAAGVYTVTLTISDGAGEDTRTRSGYITVTYPQTTHVGDLSAALAPSGPQRTLARCTIKVEGSDGLALEGAVVHVAYEGPTSGTVAGTTLAGGTVTVETTSYRDPIEAWCFTVTDIEYPGLTYDPDADEADEACSEGVVSGAGAIPTAFALAQNAPNPFNPMTTIRYSLPADSQVLLRVFNVRGQVVATLVDRAMPAGYHQAIWDARGKPSGVYFYRLQAGGFTETRKMVMLK